MTSDRLHLRRTFDSVAERYDRARPRYPTAMVDDLVALDLAGPGRRVLEIGPGTGQLTVALAGRGCRITAVELGAGLAAVARRNLAGFPGVEVVTADFDRWPLPAEPYDLVIAATAFHWLDPDTRMQRTADALRPGGALAVVRTSHIAGGTAAFFDEVQDCYARFDPASTAPDFRLPRPADILEDDGEAVRSGRYAHTAVRRYEWEQAYTVTEYLDMLGTYSSNLSLPPGTAADLLACIGEVMTRRYGGRVVMRYLTQLGLSERT